MHFLEALGTFSPKNKAQLDRANGLVGFAGSQRPPSVHS